MKDVTLQRIDPANNMARFYKIDLQPNLFGEYVVIREWGRIGQSGAVRSVAYKTAAAAEAAYEYQCVCKLKRGYQPLLN